MSTADDILDSTVAKPPQWKRWLAMEAFAVALGASYTILITYGIVWCWPAAIISSGIFIYLCYSKQLYAETALHLFYVAMAVYGWLTWNASGDGTYSTWPWQTHAWYIGVGVLVSLIIAGPLRKYTNAFWPGVDTFTAVFSVIATFMMIQGVADNWYYWIVIDTVSIVLYASRGMYLTALLFVVYTILSINGAIQWGQAG